MEFDVPKAKHWMMILNSKIQDHKHDLTDLDLAIGDGDHGLNMARGFQEVMNKIENKEYPDLSTLFKEIGMTIISKVGGASGPLYGTAFIKASSIFQDKESITISELAQAFNASLEGLKLRGRAQIGDKTMIDVWEPVVTFMMEQGDSLRPNDLAQLAEKTKEATKNLEAKKGRAAYLGKRSIGHIDPGAASSCYLFEALANVLEGEDFDE
ncbi:dihydroxyacetone kinase subunit DhaL [Metabacillus litoralis]|uniref:dihydroxyacetone kinase subunit DhaL n=1 Tax=Metabacillus litoralis TaxID=152268 RepID=UPI00203B34A4|nr:dihydroxyacetone kinase subunit DhaL [Metabacillus litoralis]MCM3163370.1 dihydroxyacetone kinase subunit DhaL [Metabacillus litoralis]